MDKSASQSKGIGDTQSKPQTGYMSRESLKKLAAEIRRQESTRERTVKKSKNNHEL